MVQLMLAAGLLLPAPRGQPLMQRCHPPRCQFKMPDFFQPDSEPPQPSPPPAPPKKVLTVDRIRLLTAHATFDPPLAQDANPFASLIEAFTPVEVDRDGNVVPDAPLPTLFGDAKQPKQTEATTDEEDARAKQRIAAIDAGEKDVGEKLYDFFFGAPVEGEVAGLARTAGAPDTYPATKTEFADPVEGDSAEVQLLRPMLKNTNLEFLSLRLAYDSSKHDV
jgi:hypothetical protein